MLLMDRLRLPMERQIRRLKRSFRPSEAEDARQEVQRLFLELLYEYDYRRNGNFEAYMCTMLKWRVHNFGRTSGASRRRTPPTTSRSATRLRPISPSSACAKASPRRSRPFTPSSR